MVRLPGEWEVNSAVERPGAVWHRGTESRCPRVLAEETAGETRRHELGQDEL